MPNDRTHCSVFVTVGTDHHPFDRLVRWMDEWLAARGDTVTCFVQRGTSSAPRQAESAEFLTYEEMAIKMRTADAVVSHGGPASIMLARHSGTKPIVVPRRKELGEHVDDHQVAFSRRIACEGTILLAESEHHFHALLDRAVKEGLVVASSGLDASCQQAVSRFQQLVDNLLGSERAAPVGAGARRGH
jgi:UDP-N-acetylglucosamine transferase subunit ALG13